jgi:cobalamin biosynthesis protein CobT
MAIDGLSLINVGVTRDILPAEIQLQAQEASNLHAVMKKIEETDKQQLDPNGNKNKDRRQKRKEEDEQQKTISDLFDEVSEPAKSDVQYNEKALQLTENKSEYKVMYNSHEEIVEIIHIKTGQVKETLTLEELKGFIMRVKNPLGIIVDRTA